MRCVEATLIAYINKMELGRTNFSISLPYEECVEIFDELFEGYDFLEVIQFMTIMGVGHYLVSKAIDRTVLKIDDGNVAKLWIANAN